MVKPKLLLVDDDKNALDGLKKILTRSGYAVSGVISGDTALDILLRKKFDIIITDLNLPGMGGLTLIQEIRKRKLPVSIIVITAYDADIALNTKKYGVDDYLAKPVNVDELELVLEKLWENQKPVDTF
ncbi:MAG: response regulator [Planctomycetes bacterium]|nr:response regulator [Planctomycetota bacterium]